MILQQARSYLAPYIENGRCSDTNVVRNHINEAQRRLYNTGNYIGTIRRWGVTVSDNGEFNMPTQCATVVRIAELPDGMQHSTNGIQHSTDAMAFVFDSPSILRFTMISPGRYKIIGTYPPAVDVMGKVVYRDASLEADSLIITDPDALKLMVLGIWRENNNAPELANDLLGKAYAHMQQKTDVAIETAKLGMYQNLLASSQYGTRGYHRAKLALSVSGGDRSDDNRICDLLDDAEKRLMNSLPIWASYLLKGIGDYFSCPIEIEALYQATLENTPVRLNSQSNDFLQMGIGKYEGGTQPLEFTYRGQFPVKADLPAPGTISIQATGNNKGIHVNIEGRSIMGDSIRETIVLDGGTNTTTSHTYAEVTSILTQPRDGVLSFVVGDTEISRLQPYEVESKYARYGIPYVDCDPVTIRAIGKPRWIPKTRDQQKMQIEDDQSTIMMSAAILLERAGKMEESLLMEQKAIKNFEQTIKNRHLGHATRINRTPSAFSLKKLGRIR